MGVRTALGTTRADIPSLVVRQSMMLTVLGVAIGVSVATVASRVLLKLLFAISCFDPVAYGSVIGTLLGVSAIACWIPAWRAARVDPSITLRAE